MKSLCLLIAEVVTCAAFLASEGQHTTDLQFILLFMLIMLITMLVIISYIAIYANKHRSFCYGGCMPALIYLELEQKFM